MLNTQQRYEANIKRAIAEIYKHMNEDLLGFLDDNGPAERMKNLSDDQLDSIKAVQCLEEEWIIDKDQREQFSMLRFTDPL